MPVFSASNTMMDDVNTGNRDADDDSDCVEVAGVGEGQSKETGKRKRQKKQTSPVWNVFELLKTKDAKGVMVDLVIDGKRKAKCSWCGEVKNYDSTTGNGPGCSSVGYGATQEIGPFIVGTDGNDLQLNPYSWNREANMLFLESPVGVGFSYSNTTSDYQNLGDDFTANDTYAFLHNWFTKFPSYRTRTFYIAGESYAGKYVPELANLIYDKNKDPSLFINLQGILLGNPETSDAEDWKGLVDYAWSHAVVSDETHKTIRESCDFNSNNTWSNDDCSQAVDEVLRQYKEIDIYSLYTSVCIANSAYSQNNALQVMLKKTTSTKMMPRILGGYDPCLDDYAKGYYNKPQVQKALHVSNGPQLKNWSICNMDVFYGWSQSKASVLPIYKKLIDAKLRIWVYSGDTDGRVPVLSTRYSLSTLSLPITRPWRPWYNQKQVGGWVQEYKGLTFATFRGAGHAVPIFKPRESLAFFTSFLLGESLSSQR